MWGVVEVSGVGQLIARHHTGHNDGTPGNEVNRA